MTSRFKSSRSQFMGRIIKKVALFYDNFTMFIVFVDVHILLTPSPCGCHKWMATLLMDVLMRS